MAWATPRYTRGRVDAAGKTLVELYRQSEEHSGPDEAERLEEALQIINNWRSSHGFPLQLLKMTLLRRAKRIDPHALIAQRIKRMPAIELKLRLTPHMKLSQMQDLGGCRAVVADVRRVEQLTRLYQETKAKNPTRGSELHETYDYINNPKPTGYRGFHFVYKYKSDDEKRQIYNNLRIEIQLRSRLQHHWATAVEIASTFTGQALKSNIGEEDWKRFFALMGTAIAIREKRPVVPGTPTKSDLVDELRTLEQTLRVEPVLTGWQASVQILTTPSALQTMTDLHGLGKKAGPKKEIRPEAFLLVLNSKDRTIRVSQYRKDELPKATDDYLNIEKQKDEAVQAVLVSVESLTALRKAYPNYYLDTAFFLSAVKQATRPKS